MLNGGDLRKPVRLVVLSGLSGSGKSTAIRALEDIGFFCIDNLPVVLLPKLVELFPQSSEEIEQIAMVVDAREGQFLQSFQETMDGLRATGSRVEMMFLDCSDSILVRRYSETRRRHPLAQGGSVEDGIKKERLILERLKIAADLVIDTSGLNPHQLRELIQEHFTKVHPGQAMSVTLVSFGFKYGIPPQADLVFDARFLPNPYFVQTLRDQDGRSKPVAEYVLQHDEAKMFLRQVSKFVKTFKPLYDREGKSYLTVAVGCTGGRHRSVAIVEKLSRTIEGTSVKHRDIDRA